MSIDSFPSQDDELILANVATEFFERMNRGESPQVEEYVTRYPQIGDALRNTLPALLIVNELLDVNVSLSGESVGDPVTDRHHERSIGDFRIIQEIGRGGMGVVYEAEQLSMGDRRVRLEGASLRGHGRSTSTAAVSKRSPRGRLARSPQHRLGLLGR